MRAAKAKGPPCIECLLGAPDTRTSTPMFMILTATRLEIMTVFGVVSWGRCDAHRDPLRAARKLARAPKRRRPAR